MSDVGSAFRMVVLLAFLAGCTDADSGDATGGAAAEASVPLQVFERENHLWLREENGGARRLTTERVGPFDYATLAARQREGVVILYWAAAPAASPDGRLIAYATNREAVAADTSGQSIWLLDVADGSERPLLNVPGSSFRPIGWLAGEVLYIGEVPGVHSIRPSTGRTRVVAGGTALDVGRAGTALVVADGVPDSVSVHVITDGDRVTVPAAPDGYAWLAQARLSDDATELLLEAAADSGRARRFVVFDIDGRRLRRLNEPAVVGGRRLGSARMHAYLERTLGFTSRDGRVFCSWAPLGAEPGTVYLWVLCEEYPPGPDSLETGSASSGPVVLRVEPAGDSLRIASHDRPGDGDRYARDLRALFPDAVRGRITANADATALQLVNREIAKRCYERSSIPCLAFPPGARSRDLDDAGQRSTAPPANR